MPAGRVLATQQARDAAKQLLALTGSVKDKVGRVLQQGSLLADPAHWGGGLAGKWRSDWGPDTNQLNQATAKLDELEHRAQLVIDDIFKADSAPGSAGVALATYKSPPQAKEKDHGLLGDIGGFFKSAADIKMRFDLGVWDGAVGFVTGLGGLIGRDPTSGRWSWSAAGTAWGGLGKFALALNPEALIVDQTVGVPGLERGELGNTLLNAGKGLIAYDEWGKDPARAAGTATFNIAAAVLGTKGAGAGLRAAGAAVDATRVAGAAADASDVAGTAARLSEISEALKEAGLKPEYVDHIPPEHLAEVQQALDEWGTGANGENQGITHIVDYAEGAGGAGKVNRLAKLTEYTGGGPFDPADPLVIPKVQDALDASVNAAKTNAMDQVRLQGDKVLYFVPKDDVAPGPNGFSNSQKGLIIIKYKGKYATFMNGTYKKFTGM